MGGREGKRKRRYSEGLKRHAQGKTCRCRDPSPIVTRVIKKELV